eukprot:CAMPEP_0184315822 /NCGR_PEP_ID=MMETSP1049-20130417/85913_1 /TAXON_ID=77928 /ORGANISM="Proteomonas sulcata, Strain CCMP704" /LENGTH=36 /DNA_ID= /DNA_START= /DNA_END= /DNA_ORIENTATION=
MTNSRANQTSANDPYVILDLLITHKDVPETGTKACS